MTQDKINNVEEWENYVSKVYDEASDIDLVVSGRGVTSEIGAYIPKEYPLIAIQGDYREGCRHDYMDVNIIYLSDFNTLKEGE